jgi:hypothetical protein
MAGEEIVLTIVIPLVIGLIIGILEAYFVYEDENMTSGKDFLGDMWHGLLFALVGILIATNVPYLISQEFFPEFLKGFLLVDEAGRSFVISIVITLIMMAKMVTSHAIKGISGDGFKEKFWHKILVSALVGFAPYYIDLFRPIIEAWVVGTFLENLPL